MSVESVLKSCIISKKGGIPINHLNGDFKELVGENIPFKKCGFATLVEYLQSLPGVEIIKGVVHATSEKTKHIEKLISKQKDNNKKKVYKKRYSPYAYSKPQNDKNNQWMAQTKITMPRNSFPKVEHRPVKQNYQMSNMQEYYNLRDHFDNLYDKWTWGFSYYNPHPQQYWGYDANNCPECLHSWNRFCIYHEMINIYEKLSDVLQNINSMANETFSCHDFSKDFECDQFDEREKPDGIYVHDHQLISDYLMLDIVSEDKAQNKSRESQHCADDLTFKKALLSVRRLGCHENVIVSVGHTDILRGISGQELIMDCRDLLQTIQNLGAHAVVCTVAPSPSFNASQVSATVTFNRWLLSADHGAQVLHLSALFKNVKKVRMELFEKRPVFVQGSKYPIIRWNVEGKKIVKKELESL